MNALMQKTEKTIHNFIRQNTNYSSFPCPLKAVSYEVEIVSGFAIVTQKRTYENAEQNPIEATLTFPVPFDAVVDKVTATVGERTLFGIAKAKQQARETYEEALSEGKTTVLHEELIRGIHMISVGNVKPSEKVDVTTRFVAPFRLVNGDGHLRIPLTVGAVFGTSPFLPSDDLVTGGDVLDVTLSISGQDDVFVNGRKFNELETVKSSYVIDIKAKNISLYPVASTGEEKIVIDVAPKVFQDVPLNADLLLDVSGSMRNSFGRIGKTNIINKWDAVIYGFEQALSENITSDDSVRFVTFSDRQVDYGSAKGPVACSNILKQLKFSGGGTQLADAVHKIVKEKTGSNIILVTDGLSYTDYDFDLIKSTKACINVLLVGGEAMEAKAGHLASLTGGQVFILSDSESSIEIISAIMRSARDASVARETTVCSNSAAKLSVGGVTLSIRSAENNDDANQATDATDTYAAWMKVQSMPDSEAKVIAEKAGIVTHLTSIVLVDQEGDSTEDMAVTRKVSLPEWSASGGVATMGFAAMSAPPMAQILMCQSPQYAMSEAMSPQNKGLSLAVETGKSVMRGLFSGPQKRSATEPHVFDSAALIDPYAQKHKSVEFLDESLKSLDWNSIISHVNTKGVSLLNSNDNLFIAGVLHKYKSKIEEISKAFGLGKIDAVILCLAVESVDRHQNRQAERVIRKLLGSKVYDRALFKLQ